MLTINSILSFRLFIFMPLSTTLGGEHHVFRSFVCLLSVLHDVVRTVSVLSGGILMKLATDIHHVSGHF